MAGSSIHESDVHDLSLSVIHALALVDVRALSYIQLRRLYAALMHASEKVQQETELRVRKLDRAPSGNQPPAQ